MPPSTRCFVSTFPLAKKQKQSQVHKGLKIMGIFLYFKILHETPFCVNNGYLHVFFLPLRLTNTISQVLQGSLQLTQNTWFSSCLYNLFITYLLDLY